MLVLAVAGSLRPGSLTTLLLRAVCSALAPARIEDVDLRAFPYYDTGADGATAHRSVLDGRAQIARADAIVVSTPEYNGAPPAALKNWLDWMTRPRKVHSLTDKPVAVVGGSPSPNGGARAVEYVRTVLGFTGAAVIGPPVAIPGLDQHVHPGDARVDAEAMALLTPVMQALMDAIGERPAGSPGPPHTRPG